MKLLGPGELQLSQVKEYITVSIKVQVIDSSHILLLGGREIREGTIQFARV